MSNATQTITSRFGTPELYIEKIKEITGKSPITSIEGAEPIGPKGYLDVLAILPCTGNTAAKLANGIMTAFLIAMPVLVVLITALVLMSAQPA